MVFGCGDDGGLGEQRVAGNQSGEVLPTGDGYRRAFPPGAERRGVMLRLLLVMMGLLLKDPIKHPHIPALLCIPPEILLKLPQHQRLQHPLITRRRERHSIMTQVTNFI